MLKNSVIKFFSVAVLLTGMAGNSLAQTYDPVGVQTNVPKSTVIAGGWSECWTSLYGHDEIPLDSILSQCQGEKLMMACSPAGGNDYVVLAQANYEDVTYNTGDNNNVTHQANQVEWYFSTSYSWGFAPAGASVSRSSCDTAGTLLEQRLCWHTYGNTIYGGWSCGATRSLNDSTAWIRSLLVNGDVAVEELEPVPVNNFYMLTLLILLLGTMGIIVVRRQL